MRLEDAEIFHLSDGLFRLDGGAMFGVVPRVLWERTNPPDRQNRILLNLGVLLIRAKGKNILVDSGIGEKHDARSQEVYGIRHRPSLRKSLEKLELGAADIDFVINTHLHFDHAGGNTVRLDGGKIAPTFPRAQYLVQRGEWEAARSRNERTRRSYIPDDFEPLEKAGCLTLVEGDLEILPGIRMVRTPGHTEHHQSVMIHSGDLKAIFLGDLIPTTSHLSLPYIMGYDLLPLVTLETKRRLLRQAREEGWLLIFQHDPRVRAGRLRVGDESFVPEPLQGGQQTTMEALR
jgi:glyoxylase-like metal-dependent hydrolase (beta-lactamase superfamily II)